MNELTNFINRRFKYKGINGLSDWTEVIKDTRCIHHVGLSNTKLKPDTYTYEILIMSSKGVWYSLNEIELI